MASKTVTQFSDDLDGSTEGVETVKFGLHGTTYEVDLSPENQQKLESALQPFVSVARKAGGSMPRRTSSSRASGSGAGYEAKAVRAWAAQNGIEVPPRGRIPGSVIAQYQAAGH
jgi:Lsr2